MSSCFQLTRKGETEPIELNTLDEELCGMLGVPVHPERYVRGWHDTIGFSLAMGIPLIGHESDNPERSMEGVWGDGMHPEWYTILAYLRENFVSSAWAAR